MRQVELNVQNHTRVRMPMQKRVHAQVQALELGLVHVFGLVFLSEAVCLHTLMCAAKPLPLLQLPVHAASLPHSCHFNQIHDTYSYHIKGTLTNPLHTQAGFTVEELSDGSEQPPVPYRVSDAVVPKLLLFLKGAAVLQALNPP